MLNIPIAVNKKLENCDNILIVGAGGGSDILCGLPLYYSFLKQGKKVHLANLTHTDLKTIHEYADPIPLEAALHGANSIMKKPSQNYVEGYLSQFFKSALNQDTVVWMLDRAPVPLLKKAYERLIEYLQIDGIILVDGGIDSMMQGDEGREVLTNKFADTTLTLAAIQQIESIQDNLFLMACNDGSKNSRIINSNLSNIASQGGFYGGCYMLDYMNSYKFMKTAYLYQKNNSNPLPLLDNIIKITDSDFEEEEERNGPVQFLFFNPAALIYNNTAIHSIMEATTYYDVVQGIAPFLNKVN